MNAGNLHSFLTSLMVASFTNKSLYPRGQITGTCRIGEVLAIPKDRLEN
jgi:hypothetical protein